ncbi:cobalamin biosynthesis protein CobW [Streptomyces sp. V2]|uniref:GTP-binding protein n=1 Tax=Streptomyces sp. V2 TaxID=1424099 RepID=UPI000D66B890|nr:GTP-binding protein [Streptomyces sp. V2]PWG10545.1 cobalamin biosynthesis protein CobW [Streptomyces sp. V2]
MTLSVAIVGGLHVEARKATVAQLLRDVPGSVVLHHDLATATAGTVVRTIHDETGLVSAGEAPLSNDCACCALREDLVPELRRLADAGTTALAIVELWDSVEPKAMAEVVAAAGLTVTSVITAIDPALLLPYLGNGDDLAECGLAAAPTDQRTVADTFARQLEYAPVLAIVDSPEADDEDRELLTQLHPTARQVPVSGGHHIGDLAGVSDEDWARFLADAQADALAQENGPRVDAPRGAGNCASNHNGAAPGNTQSPPTPLAREALAGFDVEAAAAAQHPACALLPSDADNHGVCTFVWHRARPFHPERLYEALEDLTCAAARSRGRFWLADKPDTLLHWDAAGGALCVEAAGPWLASLPDAAWDMVPPTRRAAAALDWHPEHGDCCQHLVFTSPGLDRDGLEHLLESCLLTDAEYAAGRAAWKNLPPAFDTLLEI